MIDTRTNLGFGFGNMFPSSTEKFPGGCNDGALWALFCVFLEEKNAGKKIPSEKKFWRNFFFFSIWQVAGGRWYSVGGRGQVACGPTV